MSDQPERTGAGDPIYRHQSREREIEPTAGDAQNIECISEHVKRHVGPVDWVFHEILSDIVHVDVHVVAPTPERNFRTLVTSGMSERPMHTPRQARHLAYAEVMLCLPPDWPLTQADFADESNYWPVRWLKMLARLPHQYETWLAVGHTVPNGDPARPFAPNTRLCCALLMEPVLFGLEFRELELEERTIHFLSFVPIYKEEMDLKLREGYGPLRDRLAEAGVTELLDVKRRNTCGQGKNNAR
jgi:hypothetical protein